MPVSTPSPRRSKAASRSAPCSPSAFACHSLRQAGAEVDHVFVLFSYGIFDRVVTEVRDIGATLFALATWDDVLPEAEARAALPAEALAELRAWLADPFAWSAARGGLAAPDPAWKG